MHLIALTLAAVVGALWAPLQAPAPQRVLFIGNSLTYANDLPGLVQSLSKSAGLEITCRAVAFPDYSLEDHWNRGDAMKAIRQGGWSLVVLQQGPSALPESQVLLREFTKRFDAEIRRAGARTGLYMVWPSRARSQDFDGVSRSYTNAAADVGGLLIPAGDAWRAAWKRDSSLALYSADGLHPSPAGTYLAALVILHRAFAIPPARVPSPGINAAVARLLKQAAADVSGGHH